MTKQESLSPERARQCNIAHDDSGFQCSTVVPLRAAMVCLRMKIRATFGGGCASFESDDDAGALF